MMRPSDAGRILRFLGGPVSAALMAYLAAGSFYVMIRSRNPFVNVLVLPYYAPHASDIVIVAGFFLLVWYPRYRWRALVYFFFLDTGAEIWFGVSYNIYHLPQLLADPTTPPDPASLLYWEKVAIFVTGFAICWFLLKPRIKITRLGVSLLVIWCFLEGYLWISGYPASWGTGINFVDAYSTAFDFVEWSMLSSLIIPGLEHASRR